MNSKSGLSYVNSSNIDTFDNLIKEAYTQHYIKSTDNPNEERDIINSIEEVFFQDPNVFNACKYILEKHFQNEISNLDDIYADRSKLRFQLQILSKKISDSILQKSLLYSSELKKVQILQSELKIAIQISKDSRSHIKSTLDSLSQSALLLLKNCNKIRNCKSVLIQLKMIQQLYQSDDSLRDNLRQRNFYSAIKLCLESRKEIIKYNYFKCLSELNNKIQDTLDLIEEQMDQSFGRTTTSDKVQCENSESSKISVDINEFDGIKNDAWAPNGLYEQLFKAQNLLGKSHTALDQLHMHYATAIHNHALNVVKSYVSLDIEQEDDCKSKERRDIANYPSIPIDQISSLAPEPESLKTIMRRSQYPELCACVGKEYIVLCLMDLLYRFFDILTCYYKTINWYRNHYAQTDAPISNVLEEDFTRNYIYQKLKHGVLRVCQDIQHKVNVYLTKINRFNDISFENFLLYLQAINKFVEVCKDFSGIDISETLEESIKRQNLNYLHSFHHSKVDEIKMFLENESWTNCPVKRSFKLTDLQEFDFMKKSKHLLLIQMKDDSGTGTTNRSTENPTELTNVCLGFDKYLKATSLNPFQSATSPHQNESKIISGPRSPKIYFNNLTRNNANKTKSLEIENFSEYNPKPCEYINKEESSSSSENEMILQVVTPNLDTLNLGENRMVDPSFLSSSNSRKDIMERIKDKSKINKGRFSNRDSLAPMLTNSALNILRLSGKYFRITHIYPQISEEINKCVSELYDIYLYTLYQIIIGKFHYQIVRHLISNRLNARIAQIHEHIFADNIQFDFPKSYNPFLSQIDSSNYTHDISNSAGDIINVHNSYLNSNSADKKLSMPTQNSALTTEIVAEIPNCEGVSNGYSSYDQNILNQLLMDQSVSTESLIYLATALFAKMNGHISLNSSSASKANYPKGIIANNDVVVLIQEPNQATIDLSLPFELQRLACYIISLYVVNYNHIVGMIINGAKWDIKELMSQHNTYINYIIKSFKNFSLQLSLINNDPEKVCIPIELRDLLWQNLISITFRTIVDGYSLIKKCSNEGRALMQLDLQHLLLYIDDIISLKHLPDKEFVENYIKAYYLPESEIEEWISNHQEYSVKHLIALVNNMNHLTKKLRTRLLANLEES
ncbi:unnamed protein product [Gordionus sp. m RMFG-2023]|uniref:syndetin-like n=1 Tax=Gordionus sp. m RMFG-2023 TaxID=3053472 RepID=UPI0030E09B8D